MSTSHSSTYLLPVEKRELQKHNFDLASDLAFNQTFPAGFPDGSRIQSLRQSTNGSGQARLTNIAGRSISMLVGQRVSLAKKMNAPVEKKNLYLCTQ